MTKDPADLVDEAARWWSSDIIDMQPGSIRFRGYPIEQLIGAVSFPQMVWLMLRGALPSAQEAALLEAALVAAVDHGPQAPSIAIGRMAVTCGLPLNGAMASAINVLDDVHGGAGEQCMELFTDAARRMDAGMALADAAAAAIEYRVGKAGAHIPGFGHRFHPVDPRSAPLLALVAKAKATGAVSGRYAAIGQAVGAALEAIKGRHLPMNIDGITAVIFCELGFEPELGRGLFILSRSVGILAHAWEQTIQGGRIKGPMPPQIPYNYTGIKHRDLEPNA